MIENHNRGSSESKRLFFLDNLKVALTVLVILHHLAIVFGGEGGFIIRAATSNIAVKLLLTIFLALNQSYFMGVFFVISGYFSYKSIRKKGNEKFRKSKIKRLIVPAVIYYGVFSPVINSIIDLTYRKIAFVYMQYRPGFGALWFVFALGIFDVIYSYIYNGKKEDKTRRNIPQGKKIIGLMMIVGFVAWVVRIPFPVGRAILGLQPAHFPQYIFAYVFGIKAARYDWIDLFKKDKIIASMMKVLIMIVLFIVGVGAVALVLKDITPAFGGANIISLLYCIWEQMMFIFTLVFLLKVFYKYFNRTNKVWKYAANNAYLAYIVHSSVIALIVIILVPLRLNWFIFSTVSIIASVFGSFKVADRVKRVINL